MTPILNLRTPLGLLILNLLAIAPSAEVVPKHLWRVAIVQFNALPGQVQVNLDTMERLSRTAVENGAKLVMFHELTTTDYLDEPSVMAETVPDGPSCQRMERLSKELNCYLCFGLPEREGQGLYIAYVFFGPQGFIEKYRKTWLHKSNDDPGYRNEWARFDPGTGPRVFEIAGIRATCLICADADSPRCIQRISSLKPELVFFPINRAAKSFPTYPDHVKAFGAVTLVANRVGDSHGLDCVGGSTIYDETGTVLAEANRKGAEEILYWNIALDRR